jgi:hypothetical protein
MNKILILLLVISTSLNASPNAVINIAATYDKFYDLVLPDQVLLSQAVKAYQDGYNKSAFEKFKQAAAFGNTDAQMYIGLMYLKAIGVEQDWAKGAAWLRLSAEDKITKHVEYYQSVQSQLKPNELKQAKNEYTIINEEYGTSATLKRRDRWVRKQKHKTTGSRLGSLTSNVRSFRGVVDLGNSAATGSNTAEKNARVMEKFVDNYNFGIVEAGEIKAREDK